ncbi:MAG TPA: hypothetical protein VGP97_10470 [Burkholderiales bacterium]|jgi:hypothetical protein|nr:hypothetical protein [Burkholderiales bacterium]
MTRNEIYLSEGCFVAEWSNTQEDPAVSIARARVPPSVTTRWHRLAGTAEPACRQRIANTGAGDLIFLAICTPRFIYDAYEELEC